MDKRFSIFQDVITAFDEGFDLAAKYDAMPHQYGGEILYQSEMHLIQAIGRNPNVTITSIAASTSKTASACSQMVHRLKKKGLVVQERNILNNREYKLGLTEKGWEIYRLHEILDERCLQRTCAGLNSFTDEELNIYISIQKKLNEAFAVDVEQNGKLL
jgi:DNA-binding MarR family transcriptional regulator